MKQITVETYKYDQSLHYSWTSELVEMTNQYVMLKSLPPRMLNHHSRNKSFIYDNASIEFISLVDGFTINMDIYKDGTHEYYCNICETPKFVDGKIKIVDLDIDMLINKTGDYFFVDEDEFEYNAVKYEYCDQTVNDVIRLKNQLEEMYLNQLFPFDGFLLTHIQAINFSEFFNNNIKGDFS